MSWCYRYTIHGRLVAKKNSHRVRLRNGRAFIGNSREYLRWADAAIVQVRSQRGAVPTIPSQVDVAAKVVVYLGKGQRMDSDNAMGGPFDVLQQAGVLGNDNQIKGHMAVKLRDSRNPRVEITLMPYGALP